MKDRRKTGKGIVKGTGRAVVLSVLVHVGLFLLAGMLVVFTVVRSKEVEFEPPKAVERPKMKLKKPRVKVKKSSRPQAIPRITSKSAKAAMPTIELPGMTGMGEGLGDVMDGFDIMPDIQEMSSFGTSKSIGNDFEGVFFDLKFTQSGMFAPVSQSEYRYTFYKFLESGFDRSILSRFYRSPKKLYMTHMVFLQDISAMAPVAFGMSDDKASGGDWIVHYTGQLVHKEDITFRFWAASDDALAIRVDNEIVIAAAKIRPSGAMNERAPELFGNLWSASSKDSAKYIFAHSLAVVGDWITLEAGVPKSFDMAIADNPSTTAMFIVAVEVQGEDYPVTDQGGPLLPIFKTTELTHDELDLIYQGLPEGEVDCVNGPVFRDY